MSKLQIGPFVFTVLKQDGSRILLQWVERCGTTKTRWLSKQGLQGLTKESL